MARTLADMTPGERESCVGMWCDGPNGRLVIYCGPNGFFIKYADVTSPDHRNHPDSERFDQLTPRFDLLQAWNPDGSPVVMRQEWAARLESGGASITRTRAEAEQAHARHREQYENYGTGSYDMLYPPPPAPAGIQHRFTTEWEATDE